ncbi:MAG: NAD(P)-dependent alcohol dehydrogenase [Rhodospirillales bacterium]|nr:NAD(P)-dependent alcohol dehydrogenase [Rhodospirillales bacterium]
MKAWELQPGGNGLDGLELVNRDDPEPGAGQVLVKIHATSINARDQSILAGQYRMGPITEPVIPLSDGAGEVIAVGENTTRFTKGDRVAGTFVQGWIDGAYRQEYRGRVLGVPMDGVLTEKMVLDENGLVHIPAHLSYEEAATLPCAGVTAWNALYRATPLIAGQWVLLIGTGGVSVFGLIFAKAAGARVIILSSSDEKLERARRLGADETLNYKSTPDWVEAVRGMTGGGGVHHVVEVGGGTLPQSIASVALGGQIHQIGFVAGREVPFNAPAFVGNFATLNSVLVGSKASFEDMNAAMVVNGLKPVVDRVFDFDDAHAAFEYQKSAAMFGKVVIKT